jgi:hypothetical protein
VTSGHLPCPRSILLAWLLTALGHVFLLEQPQGSVFRHFPQWRYFCKYICVAPWWELLGAMKNMWPLKNLATKGNLSNTWWWIYMNLLHCAFLDGFQGEPLHLSGVLSFKVWRQRVWMRQYGSSSLKPTNLWCNSIHVKDLFLGKLTQDRVGQLTNMFRPTTTLKNLHFFNLTTTTLGFAASKKSELIVLFCFKDQLYNVNIPWNWVGLFLVYLEHFHDMELPKKTNKIVLPILWCPCKGPTDWDHSFGWALYWPFWQEESNWQPKAFESFPVLWLQLYVI